LFFILNYQHTNLADDYRVTMQPDDYQVTMQPDDWQTLASGYKKSFLRFAFSRSIETLQAAGY